MSISKGRISNLNKKLIAGLLAITLSAPLVGCNTTNVGDYNEWFEYEKDDSGKLICNDVMMYSWIKNTKVVIFELDGESSVFLVYLTTYRLNDGIERKIYYNIFGGQTLYDTLNSTSSLNIVEETDLVDYLIVYDKIQQEYTEQDLKDILEQIKTDYESQKEKDKQLVKE